MKRVLLVVFIALFVFCGQAICFEMDEKGWEYSGNKTSDTQIISLPVVVKQVFIDTDGTSCGVALHDGTTNSAAVGVPGLLCIGANGGCTTKTNVRMKKVYADMTLTGGTYCRFNIHFVRD
jgi:hypothetical protein